jgi:hypothetical protein
LAFLFSAKLNATIAKVVLALAPWDETKSRIAIIYCLNALGANKSTAFATVAAISPQILL